MKSLILLCLFVGSLGEVPGRLQPPRFSAARFRSQRFEIVPTTESTAEPTTDSMRAPYPPSGWKPAGKPFQLPQKQSPPSTSYGTPDKVYGVPKHTYGLPTTEAPATESPENLQVEKTEGPVEVLRSVGTYFVLVPGGQLQKMQVTAQNGVRSTRHSARQS